MGSPNRRSAEVRETLERSALMASAQRRGLSVCLLAMVGAVHWVGWATLIPLVVAFALFLLIKSPAAQRRLGIWQLVVTWAIGQASMICAILLANGPADGLVAMLAVPTILGSVVYPYRYVRLSAAAMAVTMPLAGYLADPAYFMDHPTGFVVATAIMLTIPLMTVAAREAESASRHDSRVDPLTGVGNRQALALERERLIAPTAHRAPLALAIVDIDDFAAITTAHGQVIADRVLSGVAKLVQTAVGRDGQVYRFGGEEFVVVLEGEVTERAHMIAERIREAIDHQTSLGLWVSVSIGVATADQEQDFDEVFAYADAALAAAKRDGRNRVSNRPTVLPASDGAAVDRRGRSHRPGEVQEALDRQHLITLTAHQYRLNPLAYLLVFVSIAACVTVLGWLTLIPGTVGGIAYRFAQSRAGRMRRPERTLGAVWILAQTLNVVAVVVADVPALWALPVLAPMMVGASAAFPKRISRWGMPIATALLVVGVAIIDWSAFVDQPQTVIVAVAIIGTAAIVGRAVGKLAVQLRTLAAHDPLTGLPNRAACVDALQQAMVQAGPTGRRVALIVGDVDHFKRIQDGIGRSAGDALLVGVADRIRMVLRPDVSFFRLGGEQFALLAVVDGPNAAYDLAERLRRAVESAPISDTVITMSFGVTVADARERDIAGIFRRADDALYSATFAGRNCVRMGAQADGAHGFAALDQNRVPALSPSPASTLDGGRRR